jgi:hypothetical protein
MKLKASKVRRNLLFSLILISVSTLASLLLVEAGMHIAGFDYARVWEPDAELGWRHVPGARRLWTEEGRGLIEINSLGQRDRERVIPKPSGTFRIAVYGDSMTEAVQVDLNDTFTSLLEEFLQKAGYSVEVLNFGVNGYSPIQELLLLKKEGPKYAADLVILATYLDNDVSGCHPALNVSQGGVPFYRSYGKEGDFDFSRSRSSYDDYHREPLYTIRYYSRIYRWLSALRWQLMEGENRLKPNEFPKRHLLYGLSLSEEWREAWNLYEQAIKEFAAETRRQGAQFLILSVPAPWVAREDAWNMILEKYPSMRSKKWDVLGPERRLENFASEQGLHLLSPYRAFSEAWSSGQLYWGHLGHMTPRGHKVMARVIEEYLLNSHIIPEWAVQRTPG